MDVGQENHERFKNHLRQSTKDVFLVAHHLHRQGYGVYVPPFKVASNLSQIGDNQDCLLYTSPSPRDAHESRMPSSA